MPPFHSTLFRFLGRIPGRGYLLLSVIIFAAANSIIRKLTDLGAQHLIDGRNPISFCNVLFVGNLCALAALYAIYSHQINIQTLRQLSRKDWLGLMGVAVLAGAIAPAFFFIALEQTTVNNVILIGRVEPPLALALSVLLLRERVNQWVVLGAVISFVGVVLTIGLQTPASDMIQMSGFHIGRGELMALVGSVAAAIATIVSKFTLTQIPFSIFNVFRTLIATVVFFVVVLALYTPAHFMDVFSPLLWQWMLIYGGVIVVVGQLCWFEGLKRTSSAEISLASSFSPIAGVLAAFLLLGEVPTLAQYMGGTVILVGIAFNQLGITKMPKVTPLAHPQSGADEMTVKVGFKGI